MGQNGILINQKFISILLKNDEFQTVVCISKIEARRLYQQRSNLLQVCTNYNHQCRKKFLPIQEFIER